MAESQTADPKEQGSRPEFLTVRELAQYLRIKERKVYALAASGDIPCSRATGKLLFPREAVEAWVAGQTSGGVAPRARSAALSASLPSIIVGSHDPLLDWALRESRSGIAAFFDGSLDGLSRLKAGEAIAAGIHLHEAEGGWNAGHVAETLPEAPLVLLEWARRQRGLIVAPDNPLALQGIAGLKGRRFVPRQPEAGSQVLFESLLKEAGLALSDLEIAVSPARSETDIAAAVADGKADAGFGLAGVARQFRLGFLPILEERYDIAVFRRPYFLEPFQRLVAFCSTPALKARAEEYGGYDLSGFGRVHYVGP